MHSSRRHKLFAFAGMFIALSHQAASAQKAESDFAGSLLFTEHELKAIYAAMALRPQQGDQMPGGETTPLLDIPEDEPTWQIERLQLSALIYSSPQNWTLWFGNRQVRPHTVPPFLSQLRVTANYVDLNITPAPGDRKSVV